MAELTNIVNDLLKNKKTSEGLPLYVKELNSLYQRLSRLHLCFHYYSFGQNYMEMTRDDRRKLQDTVDCLQGLMAKYCSREEIPENEIRNLRDRLTQEVTELTAYADSFVLYEYILNRVEYRFKEPEYSKEYYNNGFEEDIYQYLISDRDNSVIYMKLGQLLSELPMRLSRNKFYDLLKDAFSVYRGSEKQTVLDFIYKIETSAGIYDKSQESENFPKLQETLTALEAADYSDINKETFDALRILLDEVTADISDMTDRYLMLMDVVNSLYAACLSKNALTDMKGQEEIQYILHNVYSMIGGEDFDEDMESRFEALEGIQENIIDRLVKPENALGEITEVCADAIEELSLTDEFDKLGKIYKLSSSSSFAELESTAPITGEADDLFLQKQLKVMLGHFDSCFEIHDRSYRRAVMASVLPNLPAFFTNLDEFREYTHVALTQCTDEAERQACMSLVHQMMDEDQNR